ncbi:biopolymer transport protein ExbD [bacterium BMS3Abin05]|nr:biopolymer transport protein ExbD [bacterium BMS3Abin05]GBE28081.1 biopolymer transport protein ExbD [bacterium BMS3Bbin03]HDZ13257.1 biopolymer transporter ExbD [Bacteroidota bacterium]
MKFETSKKRYVGFASISLTDIVLLLLIFFLLSSSFVVQPGIKVKLPKAATAKSQKASNIFVTITKNGTVFLNQKRMTRASLGAGVRKLLKKTPDAVVVIKADKDLTLQKTIRVIDIIKLAGAEKFIIATRPGI